MKPGSPHPPRPLRSLWQWLSGRLRSAATAPWLALAGVAGVFTSLSAQFLTAQNLLNIGLQAAPLAVLALGMNWVLLAGGIDLSVAATMYLVGVLLALAMPDAAPATALLACLALGAGCGAVAGLLVAGLRMAAFVATLAWMFIERSLGLYLSNTQGLPVSAALGDLARTTWLGLPATLWLAGSALALSASLLHATPLGRWVRAVGEDREGARRAGLPVAGVVFTTHLLCGLYAALAGFILLTQVGVVTSVFGEGMEFLAVAAAALGGTSLFGGRGGLLGPVLGALLLQAVQNDLVLAGANPYVYPLATALCILAAVGLGSLRNPAGNRRQ